MIIYRAATRLVDPLEVIEETDAERFLIHFGELEAAVADTNPGEAVERAYRETSLTAARAFCRGGAANPGRSRLLGGAFPLPKAPVRINVPEGYAYYGLFPSMYADSAVKFFEARRPTEVACVGIRSIGTSLSAVVSAKLELLGCAVKSWTARPQGHPFERELILPQYIESAWRSCSAAHFVTVDEGPGLSGSSFACVAAKLSEIGIPDHRITFVPAWNSSGAEFVSRRAQQQWRRHDKYVTEPKLPCGVDISAGRWRSLVYDNESDYPEVQPRHEARKFLCGSMLWKFSGLGHYGEAKLELARVLAGAGFSPEVIELKNGYLVRRFVRGAPVHKVNRLLLETMARYMAFRQANFRRDDPTPVHELAKMIEFNIGEKADAVPQYRPCLTDSRMLPQEWIDTGSGYIKVDAVDHGDNHFYPGPTDIAWDIAGAIVEFGLNEAEQNYLVDLYAQIAQDPSVHERLDFYTAAYLAFRIGYTKMNGLHRALKTYQNVLESLEQRKAQAVS